MAITSIDTIQAEVSALFDGIAALQDNVAFPILAEQLQGRSPVLTLRYDTTSLASMSASHARGLHSWLATLFINRRAHGNEAAEALLGQIVTAVLQAVRDAGAGSTFAEIAPAGSTPARAAFVDLDGIPYRIAEIALITRTEDT